MFQLAARFLESQYLRMELELDELLFLIFCCINVGKTSYSKLRGNFEGKLSNI
jgi:hypothetical protein